MRSATTGDVWLRAVYTELINALYEKGGVLPNDADALADELLLPANEIARCIPILEELGRTGRGGIRVKNRRITILRVTEDIREEREYRAEQSRKGVRSAEVRAEAKAQPRIDSGSTAVEQRLKPVQPPTPTPPPSPPPRKREELPQTPSGLDGLLASIRMLRSTSSAGELHDAVARLLRERGFVVEIEAEIPGGRPDKANGLGRIDVLARGSAYNLAIEIDRVSPREKSLRKLRLVGDAIRGVVLREGVDRPAPEGIDFILGLGRQKPTRRPAGVGPDFAAASRRRALARVTPLASRFMVGDRLSADELEDLREVLAAEGRTWPPTPDDVDWLDRQIRAATAG